MYGASDKNTFLRKAIKLSFQSKEAIFTLSSMLCSILMHIGWLRMGDFLLIKGPLVHRYPKLKKLYKIDLLKLKKCYETNNCRS